MKKEEQAGAISGDPRRVNRFVASAALIAVVLFPVAVAAQTLPAGWTVSDVGVPAMPGFATYSNPTIAVSSAGADQTYTVSGAGSGIGGTVDQFTFVYRELTGDATIVARVGSLQKSPRDGKAGVMIRQSLTGESTNASLVVSPSGGMMFKRRTREGRSTANMKIGSTAAPVWLKLDRRSSTITASASADGSSWTIIGSDDVPMSNVVYVGLAVTSFTEVAATVATFTNVQVTSLVESGGSLPAGWSSTDIGAPGRPGAASYRAGTFGLTGGGSDISGTWDQFHFAYTRADGDIDIVARVSDIGDTHRLSKAGVMIRESLTPNGAHATMLVTSSRGTAFQRRPVPGGTSVSTGGTSKRAPVWLKLSLRNGVVSAYQSNDGTSWMLVGTETLTLPSPFYVGLAVTSRDDTATVTTNIESVLIETAGSPQNEAPTVWLSAPAMGAAETAPANVTISADASDTDGTVARVDFYAGTTLIGSASGAPYSTTWSDVPAGSYSLTAVATDDDGATTTSAAVSVTVAAPNQAPSVSLTSPADGAKATASATLTVSAAASDADGTIARVDFYRGSTLIGSDTTSPYSVTWSNVPAGTYWLTAVAIDDSNALTTSAAASVTVTAPNQPPSVSLTAPANGATYLAPAAITIGANASDTDGTIERVDFYQGSTLIGSDTTSPYAITWNNVGPGTYSLKAVAIDDAGASTTSAVRSVTVNAAPVLTQRSAVFTASPEHDTLVTSYRLEIFAAGANPATAAPIATQNLAKPAVVNGECTADVTATINSLAAGNYQATVAAVASSGMSRSEPVAFTR